MPRPTGPHRTPRVVRDELVAGPGSDLDRVARAARNPGPHGPWPASTNGDASIDSKVVGVRHVGPRAGIDGVPQLLVGGAVPKDVEVHPDRGRLSSRPFAVSPMAVGTGTGWLHPASPDTRSSMAMCPLVISVAMPSKSAGVARGERGRDRAAAATTRNAAARTRITAAAPRVGETSRARLSPPGECAARARWRLVSKADVSHRPPRRRPVGPGRGDGPRSSWPPRSWRHWAPRRRPAPRRSVPPNRPSRTSSTSRASTSRCWI